MGANSFWLRQKPKRREPEITLRRRPFFLGGSEFRLRVPLRPRRGLKLSLKLHQKGVVVMVKKIVRDEFFLKQKSEPATKADQQVAIDLLDTLKANEAGCVGLAANMIGVKKRVIAVNMGFLNVAMFNPVILSKKGEYEAEEGCLSLTGTRTCTRYEEIEVEYFDIHWNKQCHKFSGWVAEILQHEIDHCNGIII